ncbi:hypothetical protein JK636_16715 [Clostridium sp. YIM B02515]|uniref:Uncharacterized protein n=1 Tax=Clostridium rhizosphaerae TaxID=2803861 RepID=A0ABS1TFI2_9CLOT|nr:hypothetical protein [Clostridium rhizosphaerae]MBL4937371.1 hypothetical protein [Clostridium rhizosphaerae]
MKILLKSMAISLVVFLICIIVRGLNKFSIVFGINFFIIYYVLTSLFEKYKFNIINKIIKR